jgi:DNA repair photolyase
MIISASRRTDIPAFYSDWFMRRIEEKFVYVRNPFNRQQVSKISLNRDVVDCIVFWTKNPRNMLDKLHRLRGYEYYFQFTLNPYDKSIETDLPDKQEVIDTFIRLSNIVGAERVIWRYDPILLTRSIDKEYHTRQFSYLSERLSTHTRTCVVSLLDLYRKTRRNLKEIDIVEPSQDYIRSLIAELRKISEQFGLELQTCAENIDLTDIGVKHGKCIDDELISRLLGTVIKVGKDRNQRPTCGCVESIDVGAYNTCQHGCLYCYANTNKQAIQSSIIRHRNELPILCDQIAEEDTITERQMWSYLTRQQPLF